MSQETTDNFWEVFGNLQPLEPATIFYRLYHDQQGCPVCYSMEDLPGLYIEIDQKTFTESSYKVKVKDGKLIKLASVNPIIKLIPNTISGTCCDIRNVAVVVDRLQTHKKWSLKTHE